MKYTPGTATAKRATGTMLRSTSIDCVALNALSRSDATAHGATCDAGPWGAGAPAHCGGGGGGASCGSTVASVQA